MRRWGCNRWRWWQCGSTAAAADSSSSSTATAGDIGTGAAAAVDSGMDTQEWLLAEGSEAKDGAVRQPAAKPVTWIGLSLCMAEAIRVEIGRLPAGSERCELEMFFLRVNEPAM